MRYRIIDVQNGGVLSGEDYVVTQEGLVAERDSDGWSVDPDQDRYEVKITDW